MAMDIKFPQVKVPLVGQDGNAFMILGLVTKAMRREGIPQADIDAYLTDAKSGDYDHLLRVTVQTVNVWDDMDEDEWDEDDDEDE